MSVIEKILHFIAYKGVSMNEFSKLIGVSNGYLAKQKTSQGNVGSHIIEKIVSIYPELNLEWLFGTSTEMLKQKDTERQHFKNVAQSVAQSVANDALKKGNTLEKCLDCESKEALLSHQSELIGMLREKVADKEEIISHLKARLLAAESATQAQQGGESAHPSSKAS